MRGAIIHGVLLVVMLVYGYRTWTRDKTSEPTVGSVVLWDKSPNDLVSIEYKAQKKIVKLDHKADYWWGNDTTIEMKPKANQPKSEGSGSAGSGSAALPLPMPVEEEEVGRKTHEFPLGESADKLVKDFAAARAIRDLGKPSDEAKKDYKLSDAKTTLTITFKDGPKTFLVGGSVYGGSDRYVLDQQSGHAYVLSKDLISSLEIGESSLHLLDPRGFDATKIDQVVIEAGGKTKTGARIQTGVEGQQVKTWGDPDTKKTNQTLANFIDNANNLRPTEYASTMKISDLTPVLSLTYKDDRGSVLGTLSLFKHEKAGVLPEGQDLDPANPPKGELEYYIMTEKTRVPALVRKDTAQRAEQDIETVFSGKAPAEPPPGGPTPGGPNPLNPHGGPMPPHGAMTPAPGGGSAAPVNPHAPVPPTGAGSAAPANPHAAPTPAPTAPKAAGSAAAAPPAAKPADKLPAPTPKPPAPAAGSAAH